MKETNTASTQSKVFKMAELINDHLDSNEELMPTDEADADLNQGVLLALARIKQITQNIRNHGQSESTDLKKGDTWAHLEIIHKIGHGGIGTVYCAYDDILASQVAVKFLNQRSQLYISEQQFLDEARNIAKVRHPHVLAIHGATVDNDVPGYWSDYLDGTLLSETISSNKLTWDLQLKYALHLCQAVKAIHNNQLVHGDIKATNVMIQPDRGAILLDFGSSRSDHQMTDHTYIQQASPMAMAPEQFDGHAASRASDVFSLGLLFWHMSANRHPLQELNKEAIVKQVRNLTISPTPLPGPKPWKKLILQMVSAKPERRPDIYTVEKKLKHLVNRPVRKAKQFALVALLLLATGITTISLYSNYKTKQAQQATIAMNKLLSDILMKSSPIEAGKDVLLVDVLTDAEQSLMNNQDISKHQKTSSLMQLVRTYRHQGKHQLSIDLASKLLSDPTLSDSNRLDLLMQKSAALNENKNYQESEVLLLEAIKIIPVSDQDATAQLSALVTLIYTYNESYQLDKVPALIKQAKTLWQRSEKKEAALANIYLVEGNLYEIKEQYQKAYEYYEKSVTNFIAYYGEKNLDVMIAEGAAATVLTYDEATLIKGIDKLAKVVNKMTDFLGEEHTSTLIARINLADAYSQTGEQQKALDTIVPFMPSVYKAYGETGGMTLTFKSMIAGFHQKNGHLNQAKQILEEIINASQQNMGLNSEQHIEAKLVLLTFYIETEQIAEANLLALNLKQDVSEHFTVDHRLTLDVEELLIWTKHLMGNPSAMEMMQNLVKIKTDTFGADDPSTLSAINHLDAIKLASSKE